MEYVLIKQRRFETTRMYIIERMRAEVENTETGGQQCSDEQERQGQRNPAPSECSSFVVVDDGIVIIALPQLQKTIHKNMARWAKAKKEKKKRAQLSSQYAHESAVSSQKFRRNFPRLCC